MYVYNLCTAIGLQSIVPAYNIENDKYLKTFSIRPAQ